MDKWASEEGFVHQMTAPYTPQQNGKAERFNRSFMEKVTTVMKAAKCDKALWAEAAATVVYAMNRTARAGQLLTPHELWCGQRPSVAHMRTFGCVQGQSAGTHAHTRVRTPLRPCAHSTPHTLRAAVAYSWGVRWRVRGRRRASGVWGCAVV